MRPLRASPPPARVASLLLEGREIPLTVRRRRGMRRMVLRVHPVTSAVTLSLPYGVALRDGIAFVQSRARWLLRQIAEKGAPEEADGRVITFRGETCTVRHTGGLRGVVCLEGAEILVPGAPEFADRRLRDWLKSEARRVIVPMVQEKAAALGVSIARISVRDTSSRWGSCNQDGALSFSWRLILAPPGVLEYVVAHEVAHRREMNHSEQFWKIVAVLCPHHAESRAWLRRHGEGLYRV